MNELFQALLALTVALTVTPGDGRTAQPNQSMIVPPAPVVNASTETTLMQPLEFSGKVEMFNGEAITINGMTFALAKNIEIKTALKVGTVVKIEAKLVDDKLVVTEIKGDHVEIGDDKGNHIEVGDNKSNHAEPGDDKGNHAQPGEDKGGEHRGGDDKGKK